VIKEGQRVKQLIQVCYDIENFKTKEREIKSLIKASRDLGCDDLLVITWDYESEEKVVTSSTDKKEKGIKFIPLWKWLLMEGGRW